MNDENNEVDVTVKDLISFLQKYPPDTPVYLDHDGWPNERIHEDYKNFNAEQKIRYLIDDSGLDRHGYVIINN